MIMEFPVIEGLCRADATTRSMMFPAGRQIV